MTIASAEQVWEEFGDLATAQFQREMREELRGCSNAFDVPREAQRLIYLGQLVGDMIRPGPGVLHIRGRGNDQVSADLFIGYRRSLGEYRRLDAAPFHVLSVDDLPILQCLLALVFCIGWDCYLISTELTYVLEIRGGEWMELSFSRPVDLDGMTESLQVAGAVVI